MMYKSIFIFIIGLFWLSNTFAQHKKDTAVFYLTATGKVVTVKDSADYFLVIRDTSVGKKLFIVNEYYRNGNIRLTTASLTNTMPLKLHGSYQAFFQNKNVMRKRTYENGDPIGDEVEYYPNGKFYNSKIYTPDKKIQFIECRDSAGKVLTVNGEGKWVKFLDEGFTKNYATGTVKSSFQEGEWPVFYNDTAKQFNIYKQGEMVASSIFDAAGKKVYTIVEIKPEFPGGPKSFGEFLGNNIQYPTFARQNGTQGKVIVSFIVETDGATTQVKVVLGIGDGCDEEAGKGY